MKYRITENRFRKLVNEIIQTVLNESALSANEVYKKYYNNTIDYNLFLLAIQADPTARFDKDSQPLTVGKYTPWILKLFQEHQWNIDDVSRTYDCLLLFERRKIQLPNELRDINKFHSVTELYEYLVTNTQLTRSEVKRDGELVYKDEEWLIIIPHTAIVASYYGRGTKWCTAATGSPNYFNEYKATGPLYININKKNTSEISIYIYWYRVRS